MFVQTRYPKNLLLFTTFIFALATAEPATARGGCTYLSRPDLMCSLHRSLHP